MDADFRDLERASVTDPSATTKLARAAERAGQPSLPIWSRALAQAPASIDARTGYIGAGGFYIEAVRDPYLGSAWKLANLPVDGQMFSGVYGRKLLQHRNHRLIERTAEEHLDQSVAGPETNPGGVAIVSSILQGSLDRAVLDHEAHPAFREPARQYAADQFENEKRWRIAGKFTYGQGEQAMLETIALDRTRRQRQVVVPALDNNYLTLAPQQPESALGTIAQIPDNFVPLLTELFGREYARVIPAVQYFTKRRNGNLSEVYLWTPSLDSRTEVPVRALVLGSGGFNGRFDVGCGDGIGSSGPACGWRS